MKKVASLVAAALITCSLSACGNRNTAYYRNNNQPPLNSSQDIRNNNAGTNIGSNVNTTSMYKDGVYLGSGNNRGATGNEAAIVTIRGGRIVDVALKSMDAQGRDITHYSGTANNTGTVGGNTSVRSGVNNGGTVGGNTITRSDVNNGSLGYTGETTGSAMGGTGTTGTGVRGNANLAPYGGVGGNTSVHPYGGVANNGSPYYGGNNGAGAGGTVGRNVGIPNGTGGTYGYGGTTGNNTAGTNYGYNGTMNGTNQGAVGGNTSTTTNMSTLEIARRDLAAAIIRQQSSYVNISSNQTGAVENWKLAVTRALDSARK